MSNLVRCEGCGKEISKKAASCPSCGHPNKKQHVSGGSVLLSLIGIGLFLWWLAPSGGGQVVMDNINDQVSQDAISQYEIAERSGDPIQKCVHAGMVTAAFMQAKDETSYQSWLAKQKRDCEAAGIPQ
jgi:hypothetical protein